MCRRRVASFLTGVLAWFPSGASWHSAHPFLRAVTHIVRCSSDTTHLVRQAERGPTEPHAPRDEQPRETECV